MGSAHRLARALLESLQPTHARRGAARGRLARAFMNAELVSGGQCRILIPTVYRDDYLTALRVLTRQGHADPLIEVLDFAQKYTAAIAFPNYDRVLATLRATNAMETPRLDLKLQMP